MTQSLLFTDRRFDPPQFRGLETEGNAEGWAVFSHGSLYRAEGKPYWRYLLCRAWDAALPLMGWLCANPSTATHLDEDPSVRKMIGFAKRRNFGGILLANSLGYASPYPEDVAKFFDPMGPRNVELVEWLARQTSVGLLVGGWGGAIPKKLRPLARRSADAALAVRELWCFGTTDDGSPRHPLFVPYNTPLEPWRPST